MHEHLREIGAMRLVLGQIEDQLHGAADTFCIFGDREGLVHRRPRHAPRGARTPTRDRASAAA
jgi:hypothetical protein